MLTALFLAATAPCADPQFCPTRADIQAALNADYSRIESELYRQQSQTGDIVSIHVHRPRHIKGIYCDAPLADEKTVNCRAKLYFASRRRDLTILRLQKDEKGWSITDRLSVTLRP